MKKIVFAMLILVMMLFHSAFCRAEAIVEDCEFGTYCISDTLYQVDVPEYLPTTNTKIYCTLDEVNKEEPDNNIIIISGSSDYSTSMEDLEKFTERIIMSMMYENKMFDIVIDEYDTNVSNTRNGDFLISIAILTKNGIFEARHHIIKDYKFTIISERCIDFNKKAELDANVQLVLDTYVFK